MSSPSSVSSAHSLISWGSECSVIEEEEQNEQVTERVDQVSLDERVVQAPTDEETEAWVRSCDGMIHEWSELQRGGAEQLSSSVLPSATDISSLERFGRLIDQARRDAQTENSIAFAEMRVSVRETSTSEEEALFRESFIRGCEESTQRDRERYEEAAREEDPIARFRSLIGAPAVDSEQTEVENSDNFRSMIENVNAIARAEEEYTRRELEERTMRDLESRRQTLETDLQAMGEVTTWMFQVLATINPGNTETRVTIEREIQSMNEMIEGAEERVAALIRDIAELRRTTASTTE